MKMQQTNDEMLQDLLHFSECYSNNKEECEVHNPKCEHMRIEYAHVLENLNDTDHYKSCEICQRFNSLIQKHHEDSCCLSKCVFRTVSRFYIFAKHYTQCTKKVAKKCKFCRDNHTLFKIMETCTEQPEEAILGIYQKAHLAIDHINTCTRNDCWVCHVPYLEKQGLINEFEPKKAKSIKYKKSKLNSPLNAPIMKSSECEMVSPEFSAYNYENEYYSQNQYSHNITPKQTTPSYPYPYSHSSEVPDFYSQNRPMRMPVSPPLHSTIPMNYMPRPTTRQPQVNHNLRHYGTQSSVRVSPNLYTMDTSSYPSDPYVPSLSIDYSQDYNYPNNRMESMYTERVSVPHYPAVPFTSETAEEPLYEYEDPIRNHDVYKEKKQSLMNSYYQSRALATHYNDYSVSPQYYYENESYTPSYDTSSVNDYVDNTYLKTMNRSNTSMINDKYENEYTNAYEPRFYETSSGYAPISQYPRETSFQRRFI